MVEVLSYLLAVGLGVGFTWLIMRDKVKKLEDQVWELENQ